MTESRSDQSIIGHQNVQISGVADSSISVSIHGGSGGFDPSASAEVALEAARELHRANDFSRAIEQYDVAASLAESVSDTDLSIRAHMNAARALTELLHESPSGDRIGSRSRRQLVEKHLRAAEALGAERGDLAVERALASTLDSDPEAAVRLAEEAVTLTRDSSREDLRVNALVALVNAHRYAGLTAQTVTDLTPHVAVALQGFGGRSESDVVLAASWLRMKCAVGQLAVHDLADFRDLVAETSQHTESPARIALVVDQVLNELMSEGLLAEVLVLADQRYELADLVGAHSAKCRIALNIASVAADVGDQVVTRRYLQLARQALMQINALTPNAPERAESVALQALLHQVTGNATMRLAGSPTNEASYFSQLREAASELERGIELAIANRDQLRGDTDDYLASARWPLARAKLDLNMLPEAITLFRQLRHAPAMRHERFVTEVGMPAWLGEAYALARQGRSEEANDAVLELLSDGRGAPPTQRAAQELSDYLSDRVLPSARWITRSDSAQEIASNVRRHGLRKTLAEQVAPLVAWWKAWPDDAEHPTPYSGFLDFWGRGGFARVAVALRAKPHAAISVDARTSDDVRKWARMLCPLFDTVVIKWKGPIDSSLIMIPQQPDYGGPDSFGGHGYITSAGLMIGDDDWAIATAFANLVPDNIARLLATEALSLVEAGRLVLLPAPVVGCTQSTVGWTDHLLFELLGGVVNVIDSPEKVSVSTNTKNQRTLDLVSHSLPYMADISLKDLASVLDEIDEWVTPLRTLLLNSLTSEALKTENWQGISLLENDFCEASRQLQAGLDKLGKTGCWRVGEIPAEIAAAAARETGPGSEPITDLLRAVTNHDPQLAPWIPYWRLQGKGGSLDWSHPLDNPSQASHRPNESAITQSWIRPGTPGWIIPTISTR